MFSGILSPSWLWLNEAPLLGVERVVGVDKWNVTGSCLSQVILCRVKRHRCTRADYGLLRRDMIKLSELWWRTLVLDLRGLP